jgi:NADPH2:quinone reductase
MKAFVIDKNSELEQLPSKLIDTKEPEADGDLGEVLVDIHSSALNFFDILQIQGRYQIKKEHPFVLGSS